MRRNVFVFILVIVVFFLKSCAVTSKSINRNDPLIGKVIDTATGRFVDIDTLVEKIKIYDVIYLSEKHDNEIHHRLQMTLIDKLTKLGLTPVIGFEFFSMDQTPDLMNFIESARTKHTPEMEEIIEADLRKKLNWDTKSDTMWRYYLDLLKLARGKNLAVAGIDLGGTLKIRMTRKGVDNLTPIEKRQIYSTRLSDKAYKNYMLSIFKKVHCGMGHEKMPSRLFDTWTARNDKMALSISQLFTDFNTPVVVIIGAGHTEYGLGVIDRVTIINDDIKQINIAFKEILHQPSDLQTYLTPLDSAGFKKSPPADFIFFTQRASYENPCDTFKKSLKKLKKNR